MRYFGLFTYGFGFLGCLFFAIWGVLLIASPEKAFPIYRFFEGKERFSRHAPRYAKVARWQNAVVGICGIGFAITGLIALCRSLLYHP